LQILTLRLDQEVKMLFQIRSSSQCGTSNKTKFSVGSSSESDLEQIEMDEMDDHNKGLLWKRWRFTLTLNWNRSVENAEWINVHHNIRLTECPAVHSEKNGADYVLSKNWTFPTIADLIGIWLMTKSTHLRLCFWQKWGIWCYWCWTQTQARTIYRQNNEKV